MSVDTALQELADLPVAVPAGLSASAWANGRRQHRLRIRAWVGAGLLTLALVVGVIVSAHPAIAAPERTATAAHSSESAFTPSPLITAHLARRAGP